MTAGRFTNINFSSAFRFGNGWCVFTSASYGKTVNFSDGQNDEDDIVRRDCETCGRWERRVFNFSHFE